MVRMVKNRLHPPSGHGFKFFNQIHETFIGSEFKALDSPLDMVQAGRLMKCLVRWGNVCI